MKFSRTLLSLAVASAAFASASASAVTFNLNIPAGAIYGTVTLTQFDSDTVAVHVDLGSVGPSTNGTYRFVDTGGHDAFGFNIAGGAAVISGLTAGYEIAGAFTQSGFGTFTNGITCLESCQGGTNSNSPNDILDFHVDRAGITVGSFVANNSNFIFTADLFGPNPTGGSVTFPVGASAPVAVVPEPGTYALLLAGLGVVGFMARRRQPQA